MAAGRSPERVVMLGLDGLSQSFIDASLVQESMPNLQTLLRDSALGALKSTFPPYTAPAWTSITTGVDPGRHGVFGFTDVNGRPIADPQVAAPRVWDYVGRAGGRSIVVNIPITYPARPMEGILVAGMPAPSGASFAWPQQLSEELRSTGYVVDVAVREGAKESLRTMEALRRMTEIRGRTVARLAARETWDYFGVVFVLPDRIGHPWWKHIVPGSSHYETRAAERVRRHARGPLRALDDAIGGLLGALPSGTAVIVCSDHGFGPLRAEVFVDVALARAGLAPLPAGRFGHRLASRLGRSHLGRMAPERLRRAMRDRLATAGDGSEERAAWAAPSYESGVRLRDPGDESLAARAVEVLEGLTEPGGSPVMRSVLRREDVYHGPHVEAAPHLVCEPLDESVDIHDGLHAPDPWVSRESLTWGTHTSQGIVALSGAQAQEGLAGHAPDIAVTSLSLLGLRVEGLDGSSLVEPQSLPPSEPVMAGSDHAGRSQGGPAYSPDQEEEVLEHLRGLGYVD